METSKENNSFPTQKIVLHVRCLSTRFNNHLKQAWSVFGAQDPRMEPTWDEEDELPEIKEHTDHSSNI